jgi:hypothetical protein
MSLGSVTIPNVGVPLTGLEATASVGELSPATVTGVTLDAMTASTGSVIIEYKFPVTGVSATASLGTIATIPDQVIGVSLDAMTSSLGVVGIIHYANIDTGSNTSYSSVSTGSNSSYSNVATGSNTSYTDVTGKEAA